MTGANLPIDWYGLRQYLSRQEVLHLCAWATAARLGRPPRRWPRTGKLIVFARLNDEHTTRAYESSDDA